MRYILTYSARLVLREWRRFVLPFVSLVCTAAIVLSVILITTSANTFLSERNKELIGGDVSLETNFPLSDQQQERFADLVPISRVSEEFTFVSVVRCGDTSVPTRVQVIDSMYPLYGSIGVAGGVPYQYPNANEMYIDQGVQSACEKGGVVNQIAFGNAIYTQKGVVDRDPRQVLSGFGFLPKVFISKEGFLQSGLSQNNLRAEYDTYFILENPSEQALEAFVAEATQAGAQVAIAGQTRTGFIEGLRAVEQFLILTVLLVCILSAVNVYTGILYIIRALRKSFAVLLTLGVSRGKLVAIVALALAYVVGGAIVLGFVCGVLVFWLVQDAAIQSANIVLPSVSYALPGLLTIGVIGAVSCAAFVPGIRSFFSLKPRELLSQGTDTPSRINILTLCIIVGTTLTPLVVLAFFLLGDFWIASIAIAILAGIYVLCAIFFFVFVQILYKKRTRVSFSLRTIFAYKWSDGIFGIVSMTSLYIALTALTILVLSQSALNRFLTQDLASTVPGVYVIDVQRSQVQQMKDAFPELTLFPNVGARIVTIDGRDIQKAIAEGDEEVDRELGREYNLTYRTELLDSEVVSDGVWLSGKRGEVSVDQEFAERVGIAFGSNITFSIQGVLVDTTVTSIRASETRSGLPFFFFVFNPQDLEMYPATYFGYAYYADEEKDALIRYIGETFANVSVIDTESVAQFVISITQALAVIVFVIFVPPVVLATLLIITLVVIAFANRKKGMAQLTMLGARPWFVQKLYYLETISATLLAGVFGYVTGVLVTFFVTEYYIELPDHVWFTWSLVGVLLFILILVVSVAYLLWKTDKRSLRSILAYEEE